MRSCVECRHFSAARICMAATPAWAIVLLTSHGENHADVGPQNEWQAQYCDVFSARTALGAGDRVRKKSGSRWQGRVVGQYSTELTPEGVAVESEHHFGSVQIYPVGALERVEGEPR